MTSNANRYQARVYEAYRAWCKQGKAQESLDSIAESFDVDPWHIELEYRTALDLY
jgi:phage/plasmid-associated DNA primase